MYFLDPLELSHSSEVLFNKEAAGTKDSSQVPEFAKKKSPNKLEPEEDHINSEIDKSETSRKEINVIDRQNSFRATRNFFAKQGGGLIISPKEYKKNEEKGIVDEIRFQSTEASNKSRPLSNK